MSCPLCGQRKGRRGCPALGERICAVCCGTKRLTQIKCPSDCGYLASAREHPPAAVLRQQQLGLSALVSVLQDLSRRQSQLLVAISACIARYEPPELHRLVDTDLAEAAAALAATFETAARGVVYEHRPTSLPADRLVTELKPLLAEAGRQGGSHFERDAALVLRRIEEGVARCRAMDQENGKLFLELLNRLAASADAPTESADAEGGTSRLILP